jgi:GR25 family glycosyltransferase involved in LPS biosynthesis
MKNYIICLSKIPASIETATKLKDKLLELGVTAELFEGTYGSDSIKMMEEENRTIHPWGIKGPDHPISPEWVNENAKAFSPGVRGCFYSHYRLWQKCVELNEPIIIWEDDIVIARPYIPVDWEDVLVLALGHPTKSGKYMKYLETPAGEPKAEDYWQASMPGCCGYALKPHAAKKLVDTYQHTFLPADNAINQYLVKIQVHNYVMGIALVKKDGKRSLTRTTFWDDYNAQK